MHFFSGLFYSEFNFKVCMFQDTGMTIVNIFSDSEFGSAV